MKYFFIKTVMDKENVRFRALSSQTFEDGSPIDPTYNIQGDKAIRADYPLETVYAVQELLPGKGFYSAKGIFPLGVRDSEYKHASHRPSDEMISAYEEFKFSSGIGEMRKEAKSATASKGTTYLDKLRGSTKFGVPTVKKDNFHFDSKVWYLLIRNIQNQQNTMLIGPTGTGKTECIMLACERLGLDCHVYDMGSMYDPTAGLLGVHRLQKGGESVFDYAKFTEDIQKPGVVVLDELSRAPVTTNNILFPCLDSRRRLPVEIAGCTDSREIRVHPDCCFVATANVGVEYTGTNSMDKALVNRFFPIELDYLPLDVERDLLINRCGVSALEAKHIVAVSDSIRKLYRKQELSSSVSTRETIMVAELVADGWDTLEALELTYLPLFEGTRADGERGMVVKTLMAK